MRRDNPYYYCRLESDRANVLGQAVVYLDLMDAAPKTSRDPEGAVLLDSFECSVEGLWTEPDHGAALHRCPTRLASFAWRAAGLAQGMCLDPRDGQYAEWLRNLAGYVRFAGSDDSLEAGRTKHRKLLRHAIQTFNGGFLTWGAIGEGDALNIPEGWTSSAPAAEHQIAFAALPDRHTVVGLQYARTGATRSYPTEIKGLHLNLPNDLYNDLQRMLHLPAGPMSVKSPPPADELLNLNSRWTSLDGRLGVAGLYGAESLKLSRSAQRRGGRYRTLFVDELCFPGRVGTFSADPHHVLLDAGWLVSTDADAATTQRLAGAASSVAVPAALRAVVVTARDLRRYLLVLNVSDEPQMLEPAAALAAPAIRLADGRRFAAAERLSLDPGGASLLSAE